MLASSLLRGGGPAAIVVGCATVTARRSTTCRSRSAYRVAHGAPRCTSTAPGRARLLRDPPGRDRPARGTLTWVFTGRRGCRPDGRPFADRRGRPIRRSRRERTTRCRRIRAAARPTGGHRRRCLRVTVTNLSWVPQYQLQVYASPATAGATWPPASATVANSGPGRAPALQPDLLGSVDRHACDFEAPPTIFEIGGRRGVSDDRADPSRRLRTPARRDSSPYEPCDSAARRSTTASATASSCGARRRHAAIPPPAFSRAPRRRHAARHVGTGRRRKSASGARPAHRRDGRRSRWRSAPAC